MKGDKLAVNKRTALKMFYDAGWDTEPALFKAHLLLEEIRQPTDRFWYADDISEVIQHNKLELLKYY